MAYARQLKHNPASPQQMYILYTDGTIEARGGALPVAQAVASVNNWPSTEAPIWTGVDEPVVAFQIIDWSRPSGYTLDKWGLVWPWGGAATCPGAISPATTGPEFLFGTGGFGAFVSIEYGYVTDFVMDPAGNGRGYLLLFNGNIVGIGTGVAAVTTFPFIGDTWARSLECDWSSKRFWILDLLGRVHGHNGGNAQGLDGLAAGTIVWGWEGRGLHLYDKSSANPHGWAMDRFGRMHRIGSAPENGGNFNVFYPQAIHEDFAILASSPARIAILEKAGIITQWVTKTPPVTRVVEPAGTAPTLTTNTRPFISWNYIDADQDAQASWRVGVFTDAHYQSGTTSEVQRLTPSGTISGGTFTITFDGWTTGAIAYNASAATIQTALEGLPSIGTGGVACGGGPINSAFVSITFQNHMSHWNWPQVTVTSSLTGTAPVITPSTPTPGVGIDPTVSALGGNALFWKEGTGSGRNRERVNVDLPNDTYRAYVLAIDSADTVGGWYYKQFTINVTALNVPTITVTSAGNGINRINLDAATGGGLPGSARFCVQYHDADWDGVTWLTVRYAEALVPDGNGDAVCYDGEARLGHVRSYRAFTYTYNTANGDWVGSQPSSTVTGTATPRNLWLLSDPLAPLQSLALSPYGIPVKVSRFSKRRQVVGATFYPQGRADPVVLTDGRPKHPTFDLELWALNTEMRTDIEAMLDSARVLLLRDPFGNAYWFQPIEQVAQEIVHAYPLGSELTPIRDAQAFTIPAQGVRRPVAGLAADVPLAEPVA